MNLNKNIKQVSKFRLRTTTALSCLFTTVMIYNSSMKSAQAVTTSTGTFTASTSVGSSCTFSAGDTMAFGAYANAQLLASSVVTANCTYGTTADIYFIDNTGMGPVNTTAYKMYLGGVSNSTASSFIEATFYNDSNRTVGMTSGAATISHTGTGISATAGTIYGKVVASQGTDKLGGAYTRTLTLQISY